jgi:hypothetical protein
MNDAKPLADLSCIRLIRSVVTEKTCQTIKLAPGGTILIQERPSFRAPREILG